MILLPHTYFPEFYPLDVEEENETKQENERGYKTT